MKYTAVYRVLLGVALALFSIHSVALADPAPQPDSDTSAQIRSAIDALGSGDPAKRDQAAAKILEIGAEARKAVYEASRGEEPELRARASELLLKLPWYREDDSPEVRNLLSHYGQLDVEKRKAAVGDLGKLKQHGHEALARLIQEEPSDDVKWAIVTEVRGTFVERALEHFRKLEPDTENAPLLAAMGNAWLPKDVEKGSKLLRQALAADLQRPAGDGGEVEMAFERLQNLALMDGRYDDVADLLRQRAKRGATDAEGEPSRAVLNLFGAHGKFGPLKGFETDLQTFHDQLGDPRIVFSLGKVYERCGQNALAQAAYRSAFLTDLVSIQDRFEQGDFLIRQGWLDLAEGEYSIVFDLAADHSGEQRQMPPELDEANAHFRLSQVAAAREQDLAAAEHMRQALQLHRHGRGALRGTTEVALQQEVDWHLLRAAKQKGNIEDVKQRIEQLAAQVPSNPDIANDVVPMLRELGREKEAKELFEKVYQALAANDDENDRPMTKNNLAWLCARCGEHKKEALQWAQEATKAMPDNAAYFDTLAEAHYQLGNSAEAVRLEERVVRARPGDRFLQAQLEKFKEADKKKGQ